MTYSVVDHLGGDCDLYIRYTEFPSKSHHDYYDDSWDNEFSIQIYSPQQGNWIAGMYDFIGCEYDLSFTIEEERTNYLHSFNLFFKIIFIYIFPNFFVALCENDCSGHGLCTATSECVCAEGYGGSDCSQGK